MEDKVGIKNIKLEFIVSKIDKYENEITYFKIVDKNMDNKFSSINKDKFNLPYFKTNDGKYLLKVKTKYVKIDDLNKDMTYICDLTFKYYKMGDVEGYYVSKLS